MDPLYDAVIIGAGLSGLTTAYCLMDFKALILEKKKEVGGRILTRVYGDIRYDMGAVLGYKSDYLPFDFKPPESIEEAGPIGLFFRGDLHTGESVLECINMVLAMEKEKLSLIQDFKSGKIKLGSLGQESYDILNAFFKVIHPGEIENYIHLRQRDAFIRYRPVHYRNGNYGLVEAYLARVKNKIETEAEVLSLEKNKAHFKIRFRKRGTISQVQARAIVLSTPAPSACDLLAGFKTNARTFLESVRYGRFTVVAIGIRNLTKTCFSYMVTPQLPVNTIYKMTFPESRISVLLFFFCDRATSELDSLSDEKIISLTFDCARKVGLGFSNQEPVFTDIQRWKHGGTIISTETYSHWSSAYANPFPGIFLAGDYLYKDFPYGMEAAVRSGIEAGRYTAAYLRHL